MDNQILEVRTRMDSWNRWIQYMANRFSESKPVQVEYVPTESVVFVYGHRKPFPDSLLHVIRHAQVNHGGSSLITAVCTSGGVCRHLYARARTPGLSSGAGFPRYRARSLTRSARRAPRNGPWRHMHQGGVQLPVLVKEAGAEGGVGSVGITICRVDDVVG